MTQALVSSFSQMSTQAPLSWKLLQMRSFCGSSASQISSARVPLSSRTSPSVSRLSGNFSGTNTILTEVNACAAVRPVAVVAAPVPVTVAPELEVEVVVVVEVVAMAFTLWSRPCLMTGVLPGDSELS